MTDDSASAAPPPITPPAMLGIVGGGPFSREFVMAARRMGYRTTVLDPDPDAPAGAVADVHLTAAYDDRNAVADLAATCAVITAESEHAPLSALREVETRIPVRPSTEAVATCDDRIREKTFLASLGVPLAPWLPIVTDDDLAAAARPDSPMKFPAILKMARGGTSLSHILLSQREKIGEAWDKLGRVPCVLEQRLRVSRELSLVLARTTDGRTACYPAAQNMYVGGMLDTAHVPATLGEGGQAQAELLCTFIAEELGLIGVLAVEMFVVGRSVYVNELSPALHCTATFTLDASATSQFEQLVRAVCGLGLGSTAMASTGAATVSLRSDLRTTGEPDWSQVLSEPGAHLHLYGDHDTQPGHAIGHLTVLAPGAMSAASLARRLRLRITPPKTS